MDDLDWACEKKKKLTFEAKFVDSFFLLDPEEGVSNLKPVNSRSLSAKIVHKRSRTDNAIKLPVGKL